MVLNKKLFFCIVAFGGILSAQIPFSNGTKWGLINNKDSVIQRPIYDSIPAIVIKYNKKNLYKTWLHGNFVLTGINEKPELYGYDDYWRLRGAFLVVKKNQKQGVYDLSSKQIVLPPTYDRLYGDYALGDSLFIVENFDKKGVVNKSGNLIIPLGNYQKIAGVEISNQLYIACTGQVENDINLFSLAGKKQEKVFTFSSGLISFPNDTNKKRLKLTRSTNGEINILNSRSRPLYTTHVPTEIEIDKLLYPTYYSDDEIERERFIVVYKEYDHFGLYDLLFNEKITEAKYDTINTKYLNAPIVKIDDKYGILYFTYEEDKDYDAKHIIANASPLNFNAIIFSKTKLFEEHLFTLPNGYQCFANFDESAKKYSFFLPKAIKEQYQLP